MEHPEDCECERCRIERIANNLKIEFDPDETLGDVLMDIFRDQPDYIIFIGEN